MIYEFTIENFRSFGAAQTLTLVKGKARNKPENLIAGPKGFPQALRVAAIFGHNASGKSNLLRAAEVFVDTVCNSARVVYPNNLIPNIKPHGLAVEWSTKPSRFEMVFPTADSRVFRYSFSAFADRIADETLMEELPSDREVPIFTRKTDDTGKTTVTFNREKEFAPVAREQLSKFTRESSLVLSGGANINVPLLLDIFNLITGRLSFLHFPPSLAGVGRDLAKLLSDDAALSQQLQAFLRAADFGIKELRLPQATPSTDAVPIPAWFPRDNNFFPSPVRSVHKTSDGRKVEFDWDEESAGTQRFAELFCFLSLVAKEGRTIVMDEFGSHIHPLLAERLVAWFQNPQHNPAGQFIFTTHYTHLMSPNLLRKDQIWFTEKTSAGESQLACLADFRGKNAPRSTEAFERNYLAGFYGAIADFGPYLSGVGYEKDEPNPADPPPPKAGIHTP